jgi:hypothetical protein
VKVGIVYLIRNDCGLYYIGKHLVPASSDPWVVSDKYYGSGLKLKRARCFISRGWHPRETIWVGKPTSQRSCSDAQHEEIRIIRQAKGDPLCLNYRFEISDWVHLFRGVPFIHTDFELPPLGDQL